MDVAQRGFVTFAALPAMGLCPGRWYLDEMFDRVDGKQMYLWRAVDAEGEVLALLVQYKRDKEPARMPMQKAAEEVRHRPE